MTVTNQWAGATTPTSVRVVAKITGTSASLHIAANPTLTGATVIGPEGANDSVVSFVVTRLAANTRYWYAVDDAGTLGPTGQFRTHPVGQASFTFGASSCAGAGGPADVVGPVLDDIHVSNHPVFQTIRDRAINENWLWFSHLGDFHYYNLGGAAGETSGAADVTNYRRGYDDVLLQPRQQQLYQDCALTYAWDDHDSGPNNGDSTSPGMVNGAANEVYRERVPAYTLPGEGIYQSWTVGRVLVIQSDTRTHRTPNTATDDASKTMLGANQKSWMRGLLETSQAEALVWLCSTPWIAGASSDTWTGFMTEANELVAMFTSTGWIDRMIAVSGDTHYLAIDTGTGASIGGIPLFLFGGLDSSFGSGSSLPWDTGPVSPGKDRYGTITVVDNGTSIALTGRGWIGTGLWREHTLTVDIPVEPGPGPGEPEPPPIFQSVGIRRDSVTWLGCNLITGGIIAELPGMSGSVSRVLGTYTSAGLTLPIPLSGPDGWSRNGVYVGDWEQATQPGQTMIVPIVNDVPTAAYIVLGRKGGTSGTLALRCVSLEGYLGRRYVGTHTWTQQDEASVIAAGLLADAQVEGIGLLIDAKATGTLRDRAYLDKDDATVLARLTELMEVEGGPEWTIDVDWTDASQTAVAKIARVRKRIGVASATPNAVFAAEGDSSADYEFGETYEDGKGANHIIATGSGEGEDRPQSSPLNDVLDGWPRYERRFSPSSSISSRGVLNSHAAAELTRLRDGTPTWEISARWDADPRLNIDWRLGDDVKFELTGHRHPFGVVSVGRAIGWELDMRAGVVKPILLGSED